MPWEAAGCLEEQGASLAPMMQIWEQHQLGASLPSALHRLQLWHEQHKLPLHHPPPRGSGCWRELVPATEQEGTSDSLQPDSAAEQLRDGNTALASCCSVPGLVGAETE